MSSSPDRTIEIVPCDAAIKQLFVLLHAAGELPQAMLPLARAIEAAFPAAAILIPAASDLGPEGSACREWFAHTYQSSDTEDAALTEALGPLAHWIRAAQARFGLLQSDTALAGFSQGATLALESTVRYDGLAGRILAFGGRYAELPKVPPQFATIHLLHGQADDVVPVRYVKAAQSRLTQLQGDATIDIASNVGHEMHPVLIERAIVRLQTCVPLRSWAAALGLDQAPPEGYTLH